MHHVLHLFEYLSLLALAVTSLALVIMTLPGLWLILGCAAIYAWLTQFAFIGWWTLGTLAVLATVAEVIDTFSAGAGAKRAGASRRGIWGAVIGGILGGILLSIPLWVVGTLIGVCIGTFAGAIIGELSGGGELGRSAWVGVAAARGRFTGTLVKLGFGCVMFVVILVMGFPLGRGNAAAAPALSAPPPPLVKPTTTIGQ